MDAKKKISMDQFLKILETTPREWKFREDQIELITPDLTEGRTIYIQDPLTAVATMVTDCIYANNNLTGWGKAGDAIGLSHEDIIAIFCATSKLRDYNQEIRAKLLKSTGLL